MSDLRETLAMAFAVHTTGPEIAERWRERGTMGWHQAEEAADRLIAERPDLFAPADYRQGVEDAARVVTSSISDVSIQRFICGGIVCKDQHGNETFLAHADVEAMLMAKATAIRSLAPKDPSDHPVKAADHTDPAYSSEPTSALIAEPASRSGGSDA